MRYSATRLRPSRRSAPTRRCESWNAKLLLGRMRMTCSISRCGSAVEQLSVRKWRSSDSSVTLVRPASWLLRRTSFTTSSARLSVEFRSSEDEMKPLPLMLGAVAYDPKVVTIWDGFQKYFAEHDLSFDYVLY